MKQTIKIIIGCFVLFPVISCKAQNKPTIEISRTETSRVLHELSADDMKGRSAILISDIDKEASYIAKEFQEIGLKGFVADTSFYQSFTKKYQKEQLPFKNVIGVLPGQHKPNEYVIISAHYDHIGILPAVKGDSIANGADDDASGVCAMIQLARFYAKEKNNARTLIFAAFTGEEIGLFGSGYFADHIDAEKVVAMINLEMIGKESKFGKNTAYITGFKYTDLGKIMQRNLKNTDYNLFPDPYPMQQLFYRSDNRSLAKKGVPAHTISTVQINRDTTYHTVADEAELLDVDHIVNITKLVAKGISTVVSGEDTPARIKMNRR